MLPALVFLLAAESGAVQFHTVVWVDDGDTVVLSDGRRVRLIGINCPEVKHGRKSAEAFGNKARKFMIRLVKNKPVRLESDVEQYDHYGRVLAYMFLKDNTFVNERLIMEGLAHCLPKDPCNKYEDRLLTAQQQAMQDQKGIWRGMSKKQEQLIGNKRSKRFHRMSCTAGNKTGKRNRIMFQNRWEAFWKGFAPCGRCK